MIKSFYEAFIFKLKFKFKLHKKLEKTNKSIWKILLKNSNKTYIRGDYNEK